MAAEAPGAAVSSPKRQTFLSSLEIKKGHTARANVKCGSFVYLCLTLFGPYTLAGGSFVNCQVRPLYYRSPIQELRLDNLKRISQ